MGELLGALGLAWPRLLLYPGGLFALLAAQLLAWWLGWCGLERGKEERAEGATQGEEGTESGGGWRASPHLRVAVSPSPLALVPPLALLSLLPLAPARGFPYGLDLLIALALIEWPRLLRAVANGGLSRDQRVDDYLPLLVAASGMAAAVGGLELTRLLRWSEAALERGLLAAATLLWLAALPRLVASGPDDLAHRLRALALLLIGTLPLLGALAALLAQSLPGDASGWLLPPTAMLGAALVLGALIRPQPRQLRRLQLALGSTVVALVATRSLLVFT